MSVPHEAATKSPLAMPTKQACQFVLNSTGRNEHVQFRSQTRNGAVCQSEYLVSIFGE